ncbi:MAG TPA: PA14 domain-containing protein [archaeon]|nr:PA14 domain-containing protein [archaeon]
MDTPLVDCPSGYICSDGACVVNTAASTTTTTTTTSTTTTTTSSTTTTTTVPGDTCTREFVCSGSDLYYRNADCTASFQNTCAFGCSGGSCNGAPSSTTTTTTVPPGSTTTTTSSTTTTTVPANVCADQAFPATYWQRNWYVYDGSRGACLGTGPHQDAFNFVDDWGPRKIAYDLLDGITFQSTRRFSVQGGGIYSFVIGGDDGVLLNVDNQPLVNDWTNHAYREQTGIKELREGSHTAQIDYYERSAPLGPILDVNYAKVSFRGPIPNKVVDMATSKTSYAQGESVDMNALVTGWGFDLGDYIVRFGMDGLDTGKRCSFTVDTTDLTTGVNYVCTRNMNIMATGDHTLRAGVYQADTPISGVWDEEAITITTASSTTTTTTVPPRECTADSQCPIPDDAYDATGTKNIYCDSPLGTPKVASGPYSYQCYAPSQCLGKQINPVSGKPYGNELCAPAYCCTGALSSTIVAGDGYCVPASRRLDSFRQICVG